MSTPKAKRAVGRDKVRASDPRHVDERALDLRGQVLMLSAAMFVGAGAVVWMARDFFASAGALHGALTAGIAVAALALSIALAWRLVGRYRSMLDQLVQALERVAAGDLTQKLNERGSTEMQRVASAFNRAVEGAARRSEDLKRA
ncbi:MAG TPA: HAMP domain-containing protein, partial [Pirellulales bacterium]|nr:HAMP domain-containing protein [Pirellulales bacterium]